MRWTPEGIRVRRVGERRWHRIQWDQLLHAARAVEEPLFAPLHYAEARALVGSMEEPATDEAPMVDPRQVLMAFAGV